jgi:hypothetical protein
MYTAKWEAEARFTQRRFRVDHSARVLDQQAVVNVWENRRWKLT